MKLIFLDIDGVLNNDGTKEVVAGYTFVDDDKVLLLKEIVEQTDAKIVLSSTWRRGWYCYDNSLYGFMKKWCWSLGNWSLMRLAPF